MLKKNGFPHNDMKVRVESALSSVDLYDVLIIIFDVHRHLNRSVTPLFDFDFGIDLGSCVETLIFLSLHLKP